MALDGLRRASSRGRRLAPIVLGLTAVPIVALAACGPAPATTTRAAGTATPKPGVASTVAFSITIPRGWSDVTGDPSVAEVHPSGPVLVVLEKAPQPPIEPGLNDVNAVIVITELSQELTASQVPQYLQSVRTAGATDITQPLPTTVGGSDGTSVTYAASLQGTPVQTQDMVVSHGGSMYEIELITARPTFAAQAHDLNQMLSHGWTWIRGD